MSCYRLEDCAKTGKNGFQTHGGGTLFGINGLLWKARQVDEAARRGPDLRGLVMQQVVEDSIA